MQWVVDEYNPFEDLFEETLFDQTVPRRGISVIFSKLDDLTADPNSGLHIEGTPFHAVRTANGEVPPLLLVYVLEPTDSGGLVRPVYVCRADSTKTIEEQVSEIAPILRDAESKARTMEKPVPRKVLGPDEPTTIDVKKLEEAIDRVAAKRNGRRW